MLFSSFQHFLCEGYRELSAAIKHQEAADKLNTASKDYHKEKGLYHLNMSKHHEHIANVHFNNKSIEGGMRHQNIANAHRKRFEIHQKNFGNPEKWEDELAGNV